MGNILKVDFTYYKKTNKVAISAITKEASFQENNFIVEEETLDNSILDEVIVKDTTEKTVFIMYCVSFNFQEAEDKVKIKAFEFFNETKNDVAMKKIAGVIKLMN